MKQVIMLVAAGLMALVLSACGEDKSKEPAANSETTVVQPEQQKSDEGDKAATTEAAPAEAAPATSEGQ